MPLPQAARDRPGVGDELPDADVGWLALRLPCWQRRVAMASAPVMVSARGFLSPPGYPGDHPCPTQGAAIQSHNDEDQSTLQCGTLGVRQERYGEDELH